MVNVDAPVINVDAPDLKTLEKSSKQLIDAFKNIVIPAQIQTDIQPLLREQKKTNRLLEELPLGGGGGGGSNWTAVNEVGTTQPLTLQQSGMQTIDTPLAIRVDDTTTASVTYVGQAAIGTATSAATWQIQKLDESSGIATTWADGDASYDNIWDNRASLSYS